MRRRQSKKVAMKMHAIVDGKRTVDCFRKKEVYTMLRHMKPNIRKLLAMKDKGIPINEKKMY